jgi:hypothetical protein
MGRAYAEGIANEVGGLLNLDQALSIHLTSNHFPPVPEAMVDPCRDAIAAANEGDYDRAIDLTGIAQYKGSTSAPAWAIIEAHHLDTFIDEGA